MNYANKITQVIFIIGLSILPLQAANIALNPIPANRTHSPATATKEIDQPNQSDVNLLVKHCKHQTKRPSRSIIEILHELSTAIDYWNLQKLSPFSCYISRGPTAWFASKKQYEVLHEVLNKLHYEYDNLSWHLGKLQYRLTKITGKPQEKLLHRVQKQFRQIHDCLLNTNYEKSSQLIAWSNLVEIAESNNQLLNTFEITFNQHIADCKVPNHFRRNWLGYSIGTIAALGAAYYYLNNQEQVENSCNGAKEYIKEFINNKIILPITHAYDALFSVEKPNPEIEQKLTELMNTDFKTLEGRIADEKSFLDQFANYCKEVYPEMQSKEIETIGLKAIEDGHCEIITHDYNIALKHPVLSMGVKELFDEINKFLDRNETTIKNLKNQSIKFTVEQDIPIQVVGFNMVNIPLKRDFDIKIVDVLDTSKLYDQTKNTVNEVCSLESSDKFWKLLALRIELTNVSMARMGYVSNQGIKEIIKLTLQILKDSTQLKESLSLTRAVAIVGPMMAVLGTGLYLTKKLIKNILPIDTTNQQLQKITHMIHHIINIGSQKNKAQTHKNNGLTLYLVEQLKKLGNQIDKELQNTFFEDLNALGSFDLTREQKLILIEQMYRRYSFLQVIKD